MGVASPADVAPRGRDAHLFEQVNESLQDKGFVVTQLESLVNWARAGSLWPMTSAWRAARSR